MSKTDPDHRRRLKNIVIEPKAQLRTSIPFFVLLIANAMLAVLVNAESSQLIQLVDISNPQTLMAVRESSERTLRTLMWGNFVNGGLCIIFLVVVTHRVFGPMVALRRQVRNLIAGKYDARVHLRRFDEFQSMAEDLNELAETLEKSKGG